MRGESSTILALESIKDFQMKMDHSSVRWLLVGAGGFAGAIVGVAILVLIELKTPGLTRQVFFLIAFALGISAAAVLFGAMTSYARYTGSLSLGTLKLSGPPVVFFAVIVAAYQLAPSPDYFNLDIYLRRPDNTLITNGKILLHNERGCNREASIQDGDRAIFTQLGISCTGEVTIDPSIDDFEPVNRQRSLSESDTSITLEMKPLALTCILFGKLIDPLHPQKPIKGARVQASANPRLVESNEFGLFSATIPQKCGTDTSLVINTPDGRSFFKERVPVNGAGGQAIPVILTQ
jgi:hypothetical protein